MPTTSPIGRQTPRVDGPLKVSGTAQYASDFHFPGILYAVPVEATIANGKIQKLDSAEAESELTNQPTTQAVFQKAAEAALRGAKPQSQNGFKVELAKRCLVHALKLATQAA